MKKMAKSRKTNNLTNKGDRTAVRMCAACRSKKPKKELVRVVLSEDKKPVIDETGKLSGRGVNICPDLKCFDLAVEKKAFDRSWKVSVPSGEWERLRAEFESHLDKRGFRGTGKSVTIRVTKKAYDSAVGNVEETRSEK